MVWLLMDAHGWRFFIRLPKNIFHGQIEPVTSHRSASFAPSTVGDPCLCSSLCCTTPFSLHSSSIKALQDSSNSTKMRQPRTTRRTSTVSIHAPAAILVADDDDDMRYIFHAMTEERERSARSDQASYRQNQQTKLEVGSKSEKVGMREVSRH